MADWTHEMLRYAFSWNEDAAHKALRSVVADPLLHHHHQQQQQWNATLLDTILLTILTERDEILRTSALLFLEEHASALIQDFSRLNKVFSVIDNLISAPTAAAEHHTHVALAVSYGLKAQALVTYTTLLLDMNCFEAQPQVFDQFVDLLCGVVKNINRPADRVLRAYACECLHQLELAHPGLLYPLLGPDWHAGSAYTATVRTTQPPPPSSHRQQLQLGALVADEMLHVNEAYARLFFTTVLHLTQQLVQEIVARGPLPLQSSTTITSTNNDTPFSAASSVAMAPMLAPTRQDAAGLPAMPPMPAFASLDDVEREREREREPSSQAPQFPAPPQPIPHTPSASAPSGSTDNGLSNGTGNGAGVGVSSLPLPPYDLPEGMSPPRLPRKLVRTLMRAISLVLETMPTYSEWTKLYVAERLSLFIRLLALPCRVVLHHFEPLLDSLGVPLIHAVLAVVAQFQTEGQIPDETLEAIFARLLSVIQNTAVEPCFRLLAVRWLISLACYSPMDSILFQYTSELCPKWHDPLDLKELKLQSLLWCFERTGRIPCNLLCVLDSLSEFRYCIRPVGAHAVVFRFLLRVLLRFAAHIDRLGLESYLCDLLRSHPHLLPSVLAMVRRCQTPPHKGQAVGYKILRSLGDFVSTLEPPSRIPHYFALLVTLAQTESIDPGYVLTALRRVVMSPAVQGSWSVGVRVIVVCRQVMLYHPQRAIYTPMTRLLDYLATYHPDVDMRDRALLYMTLLTHTGSAALGRVLRQDAKVPDQLAQHLTPVIPRTVRLLDGPLPFLTLFKSLDERRTLGLHDGGHAVFRLPTHLPTQAGDIALHERWGERPEDDWRPTEMMDVVHMSPTPTPTPTPIAPPSLSREAVSAALKAYLAFVESAPSLIRLPFVLRYKRGTAKGSGSNKLGSLLEGSVCLSSPASAPSPAASFPRQIYALEMSFSASSNFVPIAPIRIPYLSDGEGTGDSERFPSMFKLLLRLQPIAPVPTSFNVSIAFNDAEGQTYTGHLEAFFVTFQDMCLPPRAPPQLWAAFFEALWTAQHMCRSVKVLEMSRERVVRLIGLTLGPFVVPSRVRVEREDFDFEQEECFESPASRHHDHQQQHHQQDGRPSPTPPPLSPPTATHFVYSYDDTDRDTLDISPSAATAAAAAVSAAAGGSSGGGCGVVTETVCVMVFVPPRHHLLMRFTLSHMTCVVRIATDRYHLLSHMDGFFASWGDMVDSDG